jgi:hypothetical protein
MSSDGFLSPKRSSLLPGLASVAVGFFSGVVEGSNVFLFVTYCVQRPKIFRVFANLTALNALLFFSIYMVSLLLVFSPTGTFSSLWSSLFSLLWVIPMYLITILLGLQMWEDLYAFSAEYGNSHTAPSSAAAVVRADSSFHLLSETIVKLCVRILFGIICVLIEALPVVGLPLTVICQSWLDAFLCFEYRFNAQFYFDPAANRHRPLRLSVVLRRFEAIWPYYLGFGLTHVLARYWMDVKGVPYFINLAVCSVMFAINVVTTVPARPGPEVPSGWRLPFFTPLYALFVRCVPALSRSKTIPAANSKTREEID